MSDEPVYFLVALFPFDELVSLHHTSKYRMATAPIILTGYLPSTGSATLQYFRDHKSKARIVEVAV